MHTTQAEYARTQAVYNVARDKANADISRLCLQGASLEECIKMDEIDQEYGVWPAREALNLAERAMIEWAWEQVKNAPETADMYLSNKPHLEFLFNNYRRLPHIHDRLVETCFKLKVVEA